MTSIVELKIKKSELSTGELISYFREKCSICGHHLNCYPDGVIHKNLDILLKMKELTSDS